MQTFVLESARVVSPTTYVPFASSVDNAATPNPVKKRARKYNIYYRADYAHSSGNKVIRYVLPHRGLPHIGRQYCRQMSLSARLK